MLDVIYLIVTLVFFALMLGYVAFCETLGRSAEHVAASPEPKP
ncbi:MAG: hypothetical protein ABI601_12320 [bacterium]